MRSLLIAAALLVGCDSASTCSSACSAAGLRMASWDGTTCTCDAPRTCELEARAADVALGRADVAVTLLNDCSAALSACEARGGR